jgi:hypothetical protein
MRQIIILSFILVILFAGCGKNRLDIDVSGIETDVRFHRLDKALFEADTSLVFRNIENIRAADSSYFDFYTDVLLNIGMPYNEGFYEYLSLFLTDTVYRRVADSVLFLFDDLQPIEKR